MTSRERTTSTSDLALVLENEQRRAGEHRQKASHRGLSAQEPTAALTIARLRSSRQVPAALAVACELHDAPVGSPCWSAAHGVCGSRLARSEDGAT